MTELTFKQFNRIVFEVYRGGENASDHYKKAGNKAVENQAINTNALGRAEMRCARILIGKDADGEFSGKMIDGLKRHETHDSVDILQNLPWFSVKDTDPVRDDLIYRIFSPNNIREISGITIEFTENLIKKTKKSGSKPIDTRQEFSVNDFEKLFYKLCEELNFIADNYSVKNFPYEQMLDEMEKHIDGETYRLSDRWRMVAKSNIAQIWLPALLSKQKSSAVPEQPVNPDTTGENASDHDTPDTEPQETEREALINSRVGQGRYRKGVIKLWGMCAVTKVQEQSLLKASHIKPWIKSSDSEKLDPCNGLLLTPNLDSLFNDGYITFQDDGAIAISKKLTKGDKDKLGIHDGLKLVKIFAKTKVYLHYHRENVFLK